MSGAKEFDKNAFALAYGPSYNVNQLHGESNDDYRIRLAGILRENGQLIEAHEVFSGRRYDDPEQNASRPMSGIFGAVAQVYNGKSFSPQGGRNQLDDDVAAGVITRYSNKGDSGLTTLFDLLGPEGAMDFLEGNRK